MRAEINQFKLRLNGPQICHFQALDLGANNTTIQMLRNSNAKIYLSCIYKYKAT